MALSTVLGYPRIGARRELKVALESFWKKERDEESLRRVGADLRLARLHLQKECGIDLLPCGDFSFYDHVLDVSALLGVVPRRFGWQGGEVGLPLYFAMARGAQGEGVDAEACEMTKWFDTNYHAIVPEFEGGQAFRISCEAPFEAYGQALQAGFDEARPVLTGPLTYLLFGREALKGGVLELLDALADAYGEVLSRLEMDGASWVQLDEPIFVTDLDETLRGAALRLYERLRAATKIKILVTTPYGFLGDNLQTVMGLPVDALHVDLCRGEGQLEQILATLPEGRILAAGIVDGRNVWRCNLERSLQTLEKIANQVGSHRLWVAPSCSLLHVPCDLDGEEKMDPALRSWLAFSKQKLRELACLTRGINVGREAIAHELLESAQVGESRKASSRTRNAAVRERLAEQPLVGAGRKMPVGERLALQREALALPLFPTTTIGSFPQTDGLRAKRAAFRKGRLDAEGYRAFVLDEIARCIAFQEELGLDVLVHGEFERDDMVAFFADKLNGFVATEQGWVQSFGSRFVRPPVIYGDVYRPAAMTVEIASYAQSLSERPVKGMLTGPMTLAAWSFVRDDIPRLEVVHQIALALQDEVLDLEAAGLRVIQIDEPAFREAAPLRRSCWRAYFEGAAQAFRLVGAGVAETTMIHSHMCYSDFNDVIAAIRDMDADVISIEAARSRMKLLGAFAAFHYPGDIGPGLYDIHSPRVPDEEEMLELLLRLSQNLEPRQIWVNPDCGLKTRGWSEVRLALSRLVVVAQAARLRRGGGG